MHVGLERQLQEVESILAEEDDDTSIEIHDHRPTIRPRNACGKFPRSTIF